MDCFRIFSFENDRSPVVTVTGNESIVLIKKIDYIWKRLGNFFLIYSTTIGYTPL